MSLDIIIYAIVAAVLLLRLWSVLGQRSDDEVDRPNPFVAPPKLPDQNNPDPTFVGDAHGFEPLPLPLLKLGSAPASLAGGLEQIHALDANFNEKKFLQGARQAFVMIVENFARDNLAPIQRLLGPQVLPHFEAAVAARQGARQKMDSKVIRINDAEVMAAKVEGTQAIITVRFVSEQENILRDAAGQIIGGGIGKVEEVTDIWTFARNSQSADPNWILVETRG